MTEKVSSKDDNVLWYHENDKSKGSFKNMACNN